MNAYDRIVKQNQKKTTTKKRILTPSEDSDISERSDGLNVFQQSSQQYIRQSNPSPTKAARYRRNRGNIQKKQDRKQNEQIYNDRTKQVTQNQIQLVDDEQIPQGQPQMQQNTDLSLFQSYKFYMGHFKNKINYPFSKIISIDNNNSEQNAVNKKHMRLRRKNNQSLADSNQYYLENSVKVGKLLLILHALSKAFGLNFQFLIYVSVMVINFIIQKKVFYGNAQYVGQPYILLAVTIIYAFGHFLFQILIVKNRTNFKENQQKFKIYFHDGISAEWTLVQANQIKAGQIYKVPPNSIFPTDSILLHSKSSLILINQRKIKGRSPETIANCNMKQTVIKSQTIVLPISGMLEYTIENRELKGNWFEGSLALEEPIEIKHNLNADNAVFKGSINMSNQELLCMALEVGPNSLFLKNVQFPYLYKNNEQIVEKNSQILPIKKISNNFINFVCIVYILLSAIGILTGYLTGKMKSDHFYWGKAVQTAHLAFYHFMNFVIFLPIFANLSLLCYNYVMAKLIESNISKRQFQFTQSEEQNQISQTIGKIQFKDYSILPFFNNQMTLITGIQIFKDKTDFKLKKIVVKQTKFQFGKDDIQNQAYGQEHKQLIKYFMSVSLLTSVNQNDQYETSFQKNIKKMSQQSFGLKINHQKSFFSVSGPLTGVFSQGKLQVIHYFTIKNCIQYPYSINVYEIPAQRAQQNPDRRVLCLVRGDPQTVLMKAYGKKINLQSQSDKMHQQQGYQVHFVGKFTITFNEAQELKHQYENSTCKKNRFYQKLDNILKKIQPMGLLAFENQYSQQNLTNMKANPFLNLSMLNKIQSSPSSSQTFSSQNLPNIILLNPAPDNTCKHPQYESVNTTNRILGNPLLFNYTSKQIGQKILYDPIPVEQLIDKLNHQKIIVFNNWSVNNINYMIQQLKQKELLTIAMIQKDQQIYLTKLCDYSIGRNPSQQIRKYTDLDIHQRQQTSNIMQFLSIMQVLNYDSYLIYNGMYYILMCHIVKFVCYFTVQVISMAYSLGSGLATIRLPLYILTQIIILFEIIFHLNIYDSTAISSKYKDNNKKYLPNIIFESIKAIILTLIGTFIIIYSSITPHTSQGTPVNYIFTLLQIHLVITHIIILSKLSWLTQINWYKIFIIIIQMIIYYVGIIIISQTSLYQFKGVLRYIFNNKIYLVSVIVLWVVINISFGQVIVTLSHDLVKKKHSNSYQQIKRLNKQMNLDSIDN